MKNLHKIITGFTLLLTGSQFASAQSIDSINASYDVIQQELSLYVEGQIPYMDPNAIVSTEDTAFGDSIIVTVHFLQCQVLPTFMKYDTTFTLTMSLSPGIKNLKVLSHHDESLDPNDCHYNPYPGYVDSAYTELSIPLGLEDYNPDAPRLFPNPVIDLLEIETPIPLSQQKIQIFSETGVSIDVSVQGNGSVDVSHLPAGVYFLNISSNRENYTRKFIKAENR